MIFGHITSTMVVVRLKEKKPPLLLYLVAVVGAYTPDFIDKGSTQLLHLGSDRGLGHALVFNLPLVALIWLAPRYFVFLQKYRKVLFWFAAGVVLHLLEDFLDPVVLFWPLLGDFPPRLGISLLDMLNSMYLKISHPHIYVTEMIGHVAFAYLMIRDWLARRMPREIDGATE